MTSRAIAVLESGVLTSTQDLGRPGLARLGLGRGGAADRGSLRLANRLVGNSEEAAGLEVTMGGFVAVPTVDLVIAVTGAEGRLALDDTEFGPNAPTRWPAGSTLEVALPRVGCRTYVAVLGGLDVSPVLGSRSWHGLAQIGPPPLQPGDLVPVGSVPHPSTVVDVAPVAPLPRDHARLSGTWGPRDDWFTSGARRRLTSAAFVVSSDVDRTGIRLAGAPITRRRVEELTSEGLVRGGVQVPAAGVPIIFLADHPATGGYPVIAVLDARSCDTAAQLTPGMTVRFGLH